MSEVRIPKHIDELKSYTPGKPIAQIKKELGLAEVAVLWNNENNLGPSPMAMESLARNAQLSRRYPDAAAQTLRQNLAERYNLNPEKIVVGNGSEGVMNYIFQALTSAGDEIVTAEGTFVAVYIWAKAHNLNLIKTPLTAEYGFDLEAIKDAITEKTKCIYLANCNNPTGSMLSEKALRNFIESIPKHIAVIVDEAYFSYSKNLSPDFPDSTTFNYPNVITLRTFSKVYGIPGIRIGYGVAAKPIADALNKVRLTFEPSVPAQYAAIGALQDKDFVNETLETNAKALKQFYDVFDLLKIQYIPSYGNFVMCVFDNTEKAHEFTQTLYRNGVFVRQLNAFGLPHCVRVTTGTSIENEFFISTLKRIYV